MSPIVVDQRPYAPEDIIEALSPHLTEARLERMTGVLDRRLAGLALGVEDLHKSHNGSACIRTAEALGLQDVVATELNHPYPLDLALEDPTEQSVERISRFAHRWVDLHRLPDPEATLAWARARQMRVFGAGPRGLRTLAELPVDRPLLVLFGNEAEGLQPSTLAACDETFQIPMYGFTESFNVSVSVGVVLAQLGDRYRARLAAEGRAGDLEPARKTWLLARWISQDVKGAGAILRRKRPLAPT